MNKPLFDPHISLIELPVVRYIASILSIFFVFVTLAIIFEEKLFWDFSSRGFKNLVEIFSFPLGIVALAIPIMAILAANHRSEQSREQMRLTSEQNIFSNHYKHVEEFEKYCIRMHDRIIENDKNTREMYEKRVGILKDLASHSFIPTNIDSLYSRPLYKKLYPRSIIGDMKMSKDFISDVNSFILDVFESFHEFKTEDPEKWAAAMIEVDSKFRRFTNSNNIDLRYIGAMEKAKIGSVETRVPGGDAMNFVHQLRHIIYAVEEILTFDISYISSDLVKAVVDADLNDLPAYNTSDVSRWKAIDVPALFIKKEMAQ